MVVIQPTRRIVIGQQVTKTLPGVDVYFGEIFVQVIFYDGRLLPWYYISNFGRLYSVRYQRLMSGFLDEGGYYRYTITIDEKGTTMFTGIHKIELMSFCPIIETDLYIPNHKDGIKTNNFIGNLEWMTVSENTRHALDNGLAKCKCQDNSRSYITNDTVHIICKMLQDGCTPSQILDAIGYTEYGLERNRMSSIIKLIRRGKTYTDISTQYNIPGIHGKKFYTPEDTKMVCQYLSDGNTYTIEELCDILHINLEDRKMFRNYIDRIIKGRCDTYITKQFHNLKAPLNVPQDHEYYYYYN